MKKILALTAALTITFNLFSKEDILASSGTTDEQTFTLSGSDDDNEMKGKFIITAGAGFNFNKLNYILRYETSGYFLNLGDGPVVTDVTQVPMFNIAIDYGFAKRFSAGISAGMQNTTVSWRDDYYNVSVEDHWRRIHIAARADYWIVAEKELGLYAGLKIGYNTYAMQSTTLKNDPTYKSRMESQISFSPVSVQAHLGFSYWFAQVIGLNAEVGIGIGGPYVFAGGITAKF